jgi:hypothetical protein
MALKRGKTGQGYDQHVPSYVPPTKGLSADVRLCSLMFAPLNGRDFRTATNTHEQPALSAGTGGRGSKSRQPEKDVERIWANFPLS